MADEKKVEPTEHIGKLYAFIATEADNTEGICASIVPYLGTTVLVTYSEANVERMRRIAQNISNHSGRTIRLCEFTERKDLEVITPESGSYH